MTSVLTLATIYGSSLNFVSAATECFGRGLDHYFCIVSGTYFTGENYMYVMECSKDANGHFDCKTLTKNVPPSGIEQSIQDTVREEAQSNTNDSKDIGGMKSDRGLTKGPIQ